MWTFESRTGKLYRDGKYFASGYSGHDMGRNNPEMQDDVGIGPLPCGRYFIGPPHDTPSHGPFVMELVPDPANQMFGRSRFLLHGDSMKFPGTASHGCIVMSRATREAVWLSTDRNLGFSLLNT
jgi:hypothetical protein